jgi:hypothetical protein
MFSWKKKGKNGKKNKKERIFQKNIFLKIYKMFFPFSPFTFKNTYFLGKKISFAITKYIIDI